MRHACRRSPIRTVTSGTGPRGSGAPSIGSVETRTDDRLAAATGLVATLVVGVGGLVGVWSGEPGQSLPVPWWVAYTVFLVAFVADSELVGARPRWLRPGAVVAIEVVAALGVWFAGAP